MTFGRPMAMYASRLPITQMYHYTSILLSRSLSTMAMPTITTKHVLMYIHTSQQLVMEQQALLLLQEVLWQAIVQV